MAENKNTPKTSEERLHRLVVIEKALGSQIEENSFRCIGTVLGEPDRCGDVIFPRAFKSSVLKNFVKDGWFDIAHNWDGEGIGTINEAVFNGNELHIEAEFHTDEDSQRIRTKILERLDRSKKVSVSIAFRPDYQTLKYFSSGDDLLKWASGAGYNINDFAPSVQKLGYCRAITDITELYEVSYCSAGMHRSARATEAKSGGVDAKSKTTTISAILQAKIHQSFTVAADELAIRGYMDTDERIALSGAVADALKLFRENLDSQVGDRTIDPYDVDFIAAKHFGDHGAPLIDELRMALGAVHRAVEIKDLRTAKGGSLGEEAAAMLATISAEISKILPTSSDNGNDFDSELLKLELDSLSL